MYPKGSYVIPTNQRTVKVILHALEPKAPGSFVEWGFFNAIFEQKEYSEMYVMEKMAREMMEKDPKLKEQFEAKKANGDFSNSQWLMLNWFYQRTEYWDKQKDVYPVGKIPDETVVEELRK